MRPEPNFFIVGAQKSGTSWLAYMLRQHPDVFMTRSEVHYFDRHLDKGRDWYLSHFDEAGSAKVVGEKTPAYLWANGEGGEGHNPNVHINLTEAYPDARYMVTLRNPVSRAVSALLHMIRSKRLPLLTPIDRLFEEGHAEALRNWGVLEKGLYARQVEAYLERIPRERFKVMIYEQDIVGRPQAALSELCDYLEVDSGFPFRELSRKVNKAPTYTRLRAERMSRFPGAVLKTLSRVIPGRPLLISDRTREKLKEYYREENEKLFELLGREVEAWN